MYVTTDQSTLRVYMQFICVIASTVVYAQKHQLVTHVSEDTIEPMQITHYKWFSPHKRCLGKSVKKRDSWSDRSS